MGYFLDGVKNYVTFSGDATRKDYWMYQLFYFIFYVIIFILDAILGFSRILVLLYVVGLLLPSLAITVRRLHDSGHSGAWFFISFVPLIGNVWLLVLLCLPSEV